MSTDTQGTTSLTAVFGDDAKARVLDELTDGEWTPSRTIVTETGCSRDVLQLALADLEQLGVIRTERTAAGGRRFRLNLSGTIGEHVARIAQEDTA